MALDDNEAEHEDNATQEDSLEGEQHITDNSLLLCLLISVVVFFSVSSHLDAVMRPSRKQVKVEVQQS